MKTAHQIDVDLQTALAQARHLESIADSITHRVVKPMDGTAQTLQTAWKGASAAQFIRKETALSSQVSATAQQMREIAADIRAAARRIYNAEMEACRIAQTRRS
jgi:uncharacterized protein YukE